MSDKFTVTIDKDLEELIPTYIKNREEDIRQIEESLSTSNFNAIQVIGHKMAGNAGSYGFNELGAHGKAMENGAIDKNLEVVKECLNKIVDYMKNLEIKFE